MIDRRKLAVAATASAVTLIGLQSVAHGQQGEPRQIAANTLGGLIDVVISNVSIQVLLDNALNNLAQNALQNAQIVYLQNVLNGSEINVLSNILNNSEILSGFQVTLTNVLNNNEVLTNFLNNNNVAVDRVVAVDLLTAPVTIYVLP